VKLEKEWDRSHLGVAAFLQDPKTLEIRGAGVKLLASGNGAPAAGTR
jgi:hypothetical protein